MLSSLSLPALALLAGSAPAMPQDAQEIMLQAQQAKIEREAAVQNYTVDQRSAGSRHLVYYERVPGTNVFRLVPPSEWTAEDSPYSQEDAALMASGMATGLRMLAPALASEMGPGAAALELDNMMAEMAGFLDEAALAAANADDGSSAALEAEFQMAAFGSAARLVGRETVDGRDAYLLRADGPTVAAYAQTTPEGGSFTPESASLWLDAEYYVPLRLLVEGTMSDGGRSSPLKIEKRSEDYRWYGDMGAAGILAPKRQTMRIEGLTGAGMTDKERAEMLKAQEELKEAKKQLDALPKAQRDMVMKRMGGQMEQLERMASGGPDAAMEATIEILDVKVNEGPPGAEDLARVLGQ
jgi:hypothetical protein